MAMPVAKLDLLAGYALRWPVPRLTGAQARRGGTTDAWSSPHRSVACEIIHRAPKRLASCGQ
jgi:hypothetical protein